MAKAKVDTKATAKKGKSGGWDPEKHEVLASKKIKISDKQKLLVEVFTYDNSEAKLTLKTIIIKTDGTEIFAPFKAVPVTMSKKLIKAIRTAIEASGVEGE